MNRLRYSGASLGYQLASIIAGGPSPFIATALFAAFASSFPIGAAARCTLEGTGFELPVRGRGQSGCRPFCAAESSGRVGAPSQFSDSTTLCIKAAWTRPPRPQSVPANDLENLQFRFSHTSIL
jgi:hypothetical protein